MRPLSITSMLRTMRKNFHDAARTKYLVVGAILFLLAALSWPFVAVMSQGGGFTVEYDTDRRGSDYKAFEMAQGNYETCRDACANDANCVAYTYVKPWQANSAKCWLKSSVPAPASGLSCCISGVKGGAGGGGGGAGFGPRNDQAGLTGTRLTFYRGTTPEQCQADCSGNAGCKGFTYIRAGAYGANDPPMCYLMSEATAFAPSPCCISAIKGGNGGGGGNSGGNGGGGGGGGNAREINWNSYPRDQYLQLHGKNGQRFAFYCPPFKDLERVRGTDVYTDDSRICLSAVHSGLITMSSGGNVTIEILPGQGRYAGSTRNGVTSESYNDGEGYYGSFKFVR